LMLAKQPEVGVRGVLGIEYRFPEAPLQAFLEAGPGLNLVPNTRTVGTGGLGLRYFF
jgi:hypothetical protein